MLSRSGHDIPWVLGMGPDTPMGSSARDPQLSFARCMERIVREVRDSREVSTTLATGTQLRVWVTYASEDAQPPKDLLTATAERLTVSTRVRVDVSVEITTADGARHAFSTEEHMKVPLIMGAGGTPDGTPPDAGFCVIEGTWTALRNQERAAFGLWQTTWSKKQRVMQVVMASPPRQTGAPMSKAKVLAYVVATDEAALRVSGATRSGKERTITLPLSVALRALGERDAESFTQRTGERLGDLPYMAWALSEDDAIEHARRAIADAEECEPEDAQLGEWVLPHIGTSAKKLDALAHAVSKLARGVPDNMDLIKCKRFDMAGDMLAACVLGPWHAEWAGMLRPWTRESDAPDEAPEAMATRLQAAVRNLFANANKAVIAGFAVSRWVGPEGRSVDGACERMGLNNACNAVVLTRRTHCVPGIGGEKKRERRMFNGSATGLICATETSGDKHVGLTKTIAASTRSSDPCAVEAWLPPTGDSEADGWSLVVDGLRQPLRRDPSGFADDFRAARLQRVIAGERGAWSTTCWVHQETREVTVSTDGGRLVRPLLRASCVPAGWPDCDESLRSMDALLRSGALEYVDAAALEDDRFVVAIDASDALEASHMELHPALLLGMAVGGVPFAQANNSCRNTFAAGHGKQAIGTPHHGWLSLPAGCSTSVLAQPQTPMVTSAMGDSTHQDTHPSGINMFVALMYNESYTVEDSILGNSTVIGRGLGHTIMRDAQVVKQMCRPKADDSAAWSGDCDGALQVGAVASSKECVAHDRVTGGVLQASRQPGRVSHVSYSADKLENPKVAVITTEEYRVPEVGDKWSSRHGQKGLLGHMKPAEKMPFTRDGMRPDAVMSPMAFPSRMTFAQNMEAVAAHCGLVLGSRMDGTPWRRPEGPDDDAPIERMLEELQLAAEGDSPHARQIRADLERAGMHVDGSVELYDPETCQKLPGRYWLMCIYQWRSKHNVKDKTMADSAATGGVDAKTGQGTKGYAKGGGQKVGEMEQDCLLLLATTNLMYEMYLSQSDGTVAPYCKVCGLLATDLAGTRSKHCFSCCVKAQKNNVPYVPAIAASAIGFSTLRFILMCYSMNICLRLVPTSDD